MARVVASRQDTTYAVTSKKFFYIFIDAILGGNYTHYLMAKMPKGLKVISLDIVT